MNQANVPTIDLQKAGSDPSQLNLLDLACRDHGFFLLKNHGMQKEIDEMVLQSTKRRKIEDHKD